MIGPPIPKILRDVAWRLAIDVRWRTSELESVVHAVERKPSEGRGRAAQFIPYRFEFANKLTKKHKLLLAFDALVLSEALGCKVTLGKIVHGDSHATLKVKISAFAGEVRKRIKEIAVLTAGSSPPDLVLNRHCSECEFKARCSSIEREKDGLSLLSGMSEKDCQSLHSRGIFTVTQLSHTFRPRRRRRKSRGDREKYHPSLRALAIRENKIHAVGIPDLALKGTPVFLDVEGLPDRDFYYLIGIRVQATEQCIHHSFWADSACEEMAIWQDFLRALSEIENPHLIHYGSYETFFLKRMSQRYGTPPEGSRAAAAINQATNLLSFVYAQVYFPTYSNGLKEIAGYLGFRWSGSLSSGLETIAWRHRWEARKNLELKRELIDYNRQDCDALALMANSLVHLNRAAPNGDQSSSPSLVLTSDMKRSSSFKFGRNEFVIPEMETINSAAYWDYQRERVLVKSPHASTRKRGLRSTRRRALVPNVTIEYPRPSSCPGCKSELIYVHGKISRTAVDLRFMRHGVKRWITRHVAHRYRCRSCDITFYPPDRQWTGRRYGPTLIAYAIYLNIELQLSQQRASSNLNKLFDLGLTRGSTNKFKADAAETYKIVYQGIVEKLCSGRLLHVDETSVSVKGKDGYVWVLTSLDEVAYFHTPTRAGDTIHVMLKDFSGVLVTDFYTAYDAIDCHQQRCLIHLIRDLNDDLLKHPYDDNLKQLVGAFTDLVKPMIETVDRRGLKKRFLGKHRISVDRFFKRLSCGFGASEVAKKIIERLQKNRDTLFTFLDYDDVPWNNNNAEHAIKAFATLRRVIDGTTTEKGLRDFLVLLSLCETCKYKKIDFLDFLLSGSKDIAAFPIRKRKRQ